MQIGVALDYFVLKEQMQAINENFEEPLRRQHKRMIKKKKVEDKDEQEGGPTFMITTAATAQEVCVVKGDRARERGKLEDKGKREKRQAEDDREKKKRYVNDEGDSGWEEEDAVTPSSDKRGSRSDSGSNSDKVGSKRSQAISKSRRDKISRDSENGSKRNSGGRTLQAQG